MKKEKYEDIEDIKDVILIHGLYQNTLIMRVLGYRLEKLGYQVHYFKYPTLITSFEKNVDSFCHYLERFSSPFAIIGHSLGSLIILKSLEKSISQQLKRVIAITPPFHGSRIVQYLTDHNASFLIGKSQNILLPNYNRYWKFPIPLGIIAGTHNQGPTSLLLESITDTIDKDSLVGDGTVYLDETKLEGYSDFITLNRSHSMILFDPKTASLCDLFIKYALFKPSKKVISNHQ